MVMGLGVCCVAAVAMRSLCLRAWRKPGLVSPAWTSGHQQGCYCSKLRTAPLSCVAALGGTQSLLSAKHLATTAAATDARFNAVPFE